MKKSNFSLKRYPSKWLSMVVAVVIVSLSIYGCNAIKAVGKNPSGEALKRIEVLPNYKNGQFQNLNQDIQPATIAIPRKPRWLSLLKFFTGLLGIS